MAKKIKKTVAKKKVWTELDEWYVKELSLQFEEFVLAFEHNTPPKVVKELKDLMEEYTSDSECLPVDSIKMAINEWLEGGRI